MDKTTISRALNSSSTPTFDEIQSISPCWPQVRLNIQR